ncbi:MAG TPA: GGDEF domain-containing protein [Acidobacteriaceae bacterium]|jgi:diguanylate cyclase (GGDEF)-like protein|nr:GGDEF domain-containing protein [Acidobacteriaceae bacterium]
MCRPGESGFSWLHGGDLPLLSVFPVLMAVLALVSLISMRGDALIADGITYFSYAATFLGCAVVCLPYAERERGILRLRWLLFATGLVFNAGAFLIAGMTQWGLVANGNAQIYLVLLRALSSSMLLLAITLFFSQASVMMVVLDALQALLFGFLHLCLVFDPRTHDLFTKHHVTISTAIAVFLFLTSMTALFGAGSPAEARFLRLLSFFMGSQVIACFLANQVSYQWLHYELTSTWDIAVTICNVAFIWLATAGLRFRDQPEMSERPTVLVRNLMPSAVSLGNVAFGLLMLLYHPFGAIGIVLVTVVLFALRTILLQSQAGVEREQLQQLNRELEHLITIDALTGAGNRRSLAHAVAELRGEGKFALALVDVDSFKQANDHHGHLYGDEVLKTISGVLMAAAQVTPNGLCARLGGDEFALLLPGLDPLSARRVADEARMCICDLALKAGDGTISVSIGLTVAEIADGLPFEGLMRRADEALYCAKSLGRDRVELWSEPRPVSNAKLRDRSATA